jgi:hypothetical protein
MSEIKCEIIKKIGVLSTSGSGWTKELNLVSWNYREPKYDLRDWSAEREKMGKDQPPLSFGHLPLRFASGTMSPKYDNLIVW